MIKQIEIYGQRVKLYSSDNGRTWSRVVRDRSLLTGKGKRCCGSTYRRVSSK